MWRLGYNWKGFQVFFTQLNSEAMYCECIFRCRWQIGFSSLLHFVVNFPAWKIIQHCNKQLSNLSKCQCLLCWLLPKLLFLPDWTQSELLACLSLHQLHKGRQLYIFLVFLLSLATSGEARKIGFWQSKCTLGPVNEQTFSNYEASTPPTITSCKEYIALKINCFPANWVTGVTNVAFGTFSF